MSSVLSLTSLLTVVLVHGAWEDASIWGGVVAELESAGHVVQTVNLPGRAGDTTPTSQITLEAHRDAVLAVVRQSEAPVVLVGHSFGGMTISAVAEAEPGKIRRLVYVAAYLPQSGQSLQDLAFSDPDSKAGPNFEVDEPNLVARIKYEARADLFLNDADAALREGFADTMVDEPLIPLGTPVALTAERFGTVPKAYIRTLRDQVVSPALQERMLAATPVEHVVGIDSGHAPFLTRPAELAAAILDVAGK